MKIAVLGCGAIGGLFAGYVSEKTAVTAVVKDYQKEAITSGGIGIEGVRGMHTASVNAVTELIESVDVAILATKIGDLEGILRRNDRYLKDALVVTTQNGIAAEAVVQKYVAPDKIITGIVMFGATFYPPRRIVHNFEGDFVIGSFSGTLPHRTEPLVERLNAVAPVVRCENIRGAKYLKVFINLNNCIAALLGVSMQEAFADIKIAECAIRLNREAFKVITAAGIALESLPGYPKERVEGLVNMPVSEAAELFSNIMTSLSREPLYGSILQSIQRGRPSEIDYINGEIVHCAAACGRIAPLNEKLIEMIHRVEIEKKFFTPEELIKECASIKEEVHG